MWPIYNLNWHGRKGEYSRHSLSYIKNPLSRTFTVSNNFLGPFSYWWAVSHPLSRTFEWGLRMNQTVQFRHSNVNNCIDKTLFGNLVLSFFQHHSCNNMFSVKQKINVKSLGEKCQALRDLKKVLKQRSR